MSTTYTRYPNFGLGITTYANAGTLPALAVDGAVAVTLDTDSLYVFDGTTSTWKLVAGPGAALSIGTFDSGVASVKGAHIDSNALIMQSASATVPGLVNIGTQTFAGNKTFTGSISASNFSGTSSGTNTGDVTLDAVGAVPNANAASLSGQILTLQPASVSFPGVVTTGTQSLAGVKTFATGISAPGAGANSEAFGASTVASATGTLAVGSGASAAGSSSIAIGRLASSPSSTNTVIGTSAASGATNADCVVIGSTAAASSGNANVVIGQAASSSAASNVVVGKAAVSSGTAQDNVLIGSLATITAGNSSIIIGKSASTGFGRCVLLGDGAVSTAANQFIVNLGTASSGSGYLGGGVTAASAQSFTLQTTGGSGTDIAGWALNIAGGRGTGSGAGGKITFQTSAAGVSGTTLRTLSDRMVIDSAGLVGIAQTTPTALLEVGTTASTNNFILRTARTSAGAFTGNYINEIRTSAGTPVLGTLIHHAENNSLRRVLDITSSLGTIASFGSDGKVGIGNASANTILNIGAGTPTTAANGIQFGTDAAANLYRSAASTIKTDGAIVAVGTVTGSNLSGTNTGDVTLAAVGAVPNANGASLSTQQLTLQPADASFPGVVTTGAQTFAGTKTFAQIIDSGLTASRAVATDGSKQLVSSTTTATELGYLSGVTSAIQTQFGTKILAKQVFTASGTFTIPSGTLSTTAFKFTVVGAGGGGGGGDQSGGGGAGGGAGGTAIKWLTGLTAGNTITVTVGAAGTAGTSGGNGGSGGNSTIASGTETITTVTGNGGGGGTGGSGVGSSPLRGAAGGSASNGDTNARGQGGTLSMTIVAGSAFGGTGGSSTMGGGGNGGSNANSSDGDGGTPGYGGGGGGGGANAATRSSAGSAGGAGIVIVEWVL